MINDDLNESYHLASIIEDYSDLVVDATKLVQDESPNPDIFPIGMNNFRSKKFKQSETKPIKINNNNNKSISNVENQPSPARLRWKLALKKLSKIEDPWAKFKIENYQEEIVIRHRYLPVRNEWKKDENIVKMETKQFANGAMRACYRLKKLSNFSHDLNWEHASNYVAKCYKDPEIPRKRYFEDVKLQMDAKLWAELFNKHNPPKKIDIFQMAIIEFKNRPGSPLFHLEHYIEGEYIKYNSNSGFVDMDSAHMRNTPHAFSHFTFESSNHELMVVDIQGVGDLYTDPQIHTAFGNEYGEGNLNIKGFALFFYSHVCNDVCRSLGLTSFDLAPTEIKNHDEILSCFAKSAETKSFGREEKISEAKELEKKRQIVRRFDSYDQNPNELNNFNQEENSISSLSPYSSSFSHLYIREQSNSEKSYDDEALNYFKMKGYIQQRPSAVVADKNNLLNAETEYRKKMQEYSTFDSVLGKIHFEMCRYHEMGRFLNENDPNSDIDIDAAFYHLKHAANLGEVEALVNISKIYMQLPHDILPEYKEQETDANFEAGFDYLLEAAEKCDKTSLYYVAKAYDTGIGLPKSKTLDWNKAIEYYRKLVNGSYDDSDKNAELGNDCEAFYLILARIGEMYMKGGNGVELNYQEAYNFFTDAAEQAMQTGKGRLANKYYNLAEKASGFIN